MDRTLEDGGSAVVTLEDSGGTVALGGGFGQQLKIAAVALGSGCGRRRCNDGIAISIIKAKGYCHDVGVSVGKTGREDASNARDVCWQKW
jgi:hypothetical protein